MNRRTFLSLFGLAALGAAGITSAKAAPAPVLRYMGSETGTWRPGFTIVGFDPIARQNARVRALNQHWAGLKARGITPDYRAFATYPPDNWMDLARAAA